MKNKVLLIDDSKTQLDVMRVRFTKCDFEVEIAQNALEGYHKIFTFVPDIILSDIIMPDLDGYQFCRLLKNNAITKNIPIILLTVLDKNVDKFWGKKAGAQAFISKTAEFEEIMQKTLEVLKDSELSNEDKTVISNHKVDDISVNEQINRILNKLLMQSLFLNEFRNLGEYYTHEKVLVDKTLELLSTFIDYDISALFFKCPDDNAKNILYFDVNSSSVSSFVIEKLKRDFFTQMPNMKAFNTNDFLHEIARTNPERTDNSLISPSVFKSNYILPLTFENKLLGGIAFFSKDEVDYTQIQFYDLMKNELLALMKMKSLYSEVELLSVTDGLTGLYNRRHFEYNIEREFLRAKRYKNPLSFAILDIDFFKSVNDNYGHQYGDYVLKEVSNLMKQSFRKTDMIYRYGGEEIGIILPETSADNAEIPVERLREKIAQHKFSFNGIDISLTVSVGIAEMEDAYYNASELVEVADKALYHAKQTGRNKVVIYEEQLANVK